MQIKLMCVFAFAPFPYIFFNFSKDILRSSPASIRNLRMSKRKKKFFEGSFSAQSKPSFASIVAVHSFTTWKSTILHRSKNRFLN